MGAHQKDGPYYGVRSDALEIQGGSVVETQRICHKPRVRLMRVLDGVPLQVLRPPFSCAALRLIV